MTKKETIKNYVISLIIGGELKKGEKIPSEKALCITFDTSRNPVRTALKELEYSDWIQSEAGKGYFVTNTGSYDAQFAKEAFKIKKTIIRGLNHSEEAFLEVLEGEKVNNSKKFVKEYWGQNKLIIKTINMVNNDFLFHLSQKELEAGLVQGLIWHKIPITHQNRKLVFLDIKDEDVYKMWNQKEYPAIQASLYTGRTLIENSLILVDKENFKFEKKVVF
ncbi:winged helix-turn-helix domain-containing protein [Mycoplasma todarodis]|uniref:winged helix-turn-helix domain-containing protein n=1 Tax=Mycoplasma todarodis TaxID=1937191 RepID=UPI003B3431A4